MTINTNAIRERANRAAQIAPGEWYADHTVGVYAYGDDTTDGPKVFTDRSVDLALLEHIAGLGPQVATAIADELDAARMEIERLRAERDGERRAKQRLLDRLYAANPVLVAAQEWAEAREMSDGTTEATSDAFTTTNALHQAIEEYRVMDAALDAGHAAQPGTTAEVPA